jgi:hypothetical protein
MRAYRPKIALVANSTIFTFGTIVTTYSVHFWHRVPAAGANKFA